LPAHILRGAFLFDKIIVTFDNTKLTQTLTDLEMEEEAGTQEVINGHEDKSVKDEIFTRVVRAGKRTYFFDVKTTRKDDYYLTITESKKRLGKEGKVFYEKHKIFLYKEDFDKFSEGLKESVSFINEGTPAPEATESVIDTEHVDKKNTLVTAGFTDVEFEDLGKQ
jgi:Protein of unknown function (DUF3276)